MTSAAGATWAVRKSNIPRNGAHKRPHHQRQCNATTTTSLGEEDRGSTNLTQLAAKGSTVADETSSDGLWCAASMLASSSDRSLKSGASSRSMSSRQLKTRGVTSRFFRELEEVRTRVDRGQVGTPRWLIDPRTSRRIGYWDAVASAAIIFTALVTPYEVSFVPPASSAAEPLFIANRVLDLVFIVDMVLQFVLVYAEGEASDGMRWVDDPCRIASHYLRGESRNRGLNQRAPATDGCRTRRSPALATSVPGGAHILSPIGTGAPESVPSSPLRYFSLALGARVCVPRLLQAGL